MKRVDEIEMLFQSVLTRFFSIPARQPASGAVTFAQIRVLWALEIQGGSAVHGGVARRLGISDSAATELVDRLVRGGYVRRAQSSEDRRRVILSLRPRGRSMLADFARRRRERFAKLMRVVEPADVERMAAALETMNRILGKWNGERT